MNGSEQLCSPIPRIGSRADAVVPFNRLEAAARDLLAAMAWLSRPDALVRLQAAFQNLTGRQHIIFAPSGQCAIAQILSILPQKEVVLPAYMCLQVRKAAEAAGKRIIYVDLARNSLNATAAQFAEAAKPGRILLACHVYGIPTDIESICELARSHGCVIIEDAVQAFGGRLHGRLLGTFGDFGIFSFHYSKRLPALRGGVIVVNNDAVVDPAKLRAHRIIATERAMPVREVAQMLLYNFVTAPWIYRTLTLRLLGLRHWIAASSPKRVQMTATPHPNKQAAIQTVPRNPSYTRELHPYQAELALRILDRKGEVGAQIARLAAAYQQAFRDTPVATFLTEECDTSGLMRFPIAFPGRSRDQILRLAFKQGLYFRVHWERPLPQPPDLARFPNAVWTAQNLVLLPLYRALSVTSAEQIAEKLIEIVHMCAGI